jgi:hypothetical protein
MRTKRVRNWQAQPTETPMACAVCSSDNPNSSGNTTACACLSSSTVLAFAKVTLATSSNSLPLALLPISTPRWLRCGYYFIYDLEMELHPQVCAHAGRTQKSRQKGGSSNREVNQRFENCLRRRAL